jgi:hypothetical protein
MKRKKIDILQPWGTLTLDGCLGCNAQPFFYHDPKCLLRDTGPFVGAFWENHKGRNQQSI